MKRKLLDITRDKIRVKHYSIKTEKSYISWIKHYIFFHKLRHPIEMGKAEIDIWLSREKCRLRRRTRSSTPSCFCTEKY